MSDEHLKKQLIDNFTKLFYSQLGYYPIVITRDDKDINKPLMTLEQLECHFNTFMELNQFYHKLNLKSKKRVRKLVEIRIIFCYLARMMGYKLEYLGAYLNKHHSTVIYNLVAFNNLMQTSEEFRFKFKEIITYIKTNYEPHDELPAMVYFNKVWSESKPTILS